MYSFDPCPRPHSHPHPYLGDADFQIVWRYIPCLTHDVYIERLIEEKHINLYKVRWWGAGVLGCWGIGVLGYWGIGVLGCCPPTQHDPTRPCSSSAICHPILPYPNLPALQEETDNVSQDIIEHLPDATNAKLPPSLLRIWTSYHKTYGPEGHERTHTHAEVPLSPNSRGEISAFGSESSERGSTSERDSLTGSPSSPGLPPSTSQPRMSQKQSSDGVSSLNSRSGSYIGSTMDQASLDPSKMWDHVRELKRKHKKTLTKLEALEVKMAETKIQVSLKFY